MTFNSQPYEIDLELAQKYELRSLPGTNGVLVDCHQTHKGGDSHSDPSGGYRAVVNTLRQALEFIEDHEVNNHDEDQADEPTAPDHPFNRIVSVVADMDDTRELPIIPATTGGRPFANSPHTVQQPNPQGGWDVLWFDGRGPRSDRTAFRPREFRNWPPADLCADSQNPELVTGPNINPGDWYALHPQADIGCLRSLGQLAQCLAEKTSLVWVEAPGPFIDEPYVVLRGRRGRALREVI